jgi:thioredoxin-related protein
VTVVGVSMDEEGAERVRPFLQKNPMEYTVALGNDALAQQFKTDEGIPITVVFDRSGKQVKRFQGYLSEAELIAAVQAAL